MSVKAKKGQADGSRFEGNGVSYKAKLIGIETVAEARGDQMCQEAITKMKNSVKVSGQHKQKIFVNVSLDGLKIVDAISLAASQNKKKNEHKGSKSSVDTQESDQSQDMMVVHTHPVHRISFISRDTTDNRAFGYISEEEDGSHKFYGIKTAAAAEQLVLTLRDLFQAVYDQKKKEVDDVKHKLEENQTTTEGDAENEKNSGDGSTSRNGQAPQITPTAEGENIYQVPPNNAPVNPGKQAEQVANLLDLEDQADHILKGIEQIKNLEFDSTTSGEFSSPSSPGSPMVSSPLGPADPWGNSAPAAAPPASQPQSALGDLAGLQTSPFPTMQQPGPFHQPQFGAPGTPFPIQGNAFAQQGFNFTPAGLPVTKDPFAHDPFNGQAVRPNMATGFPQAAQPNAFAAPNPFGAQPTQPFGAQPAHAFGAQPAHAFGAQPAQPFGAVVPGATPGIPWQQAPPAMTVGMAMPGAMPVRMTAPPAALNVAVINPFGAQEDPNMLMPIRQDQGQSQGSDEPEKARSKSPRDDLFGDLLEMKKSTTKAVNPKEMFNQLSAVDKKSMNELKANPDTPGQASWAFSDPFGDSFTTTADQTQTKNSAAKGDDPFSPPRVPPQPAEPTARPPSLPTVATADSPSNTNTLPPPVPRRLCSQNVDHNTKDLFPRISSSSSLSSSASLSPTLAAKVSKHHTTCTPPPIPNRNKDFEADAAKPSQSSSTPLNLPLTDDKPSVINSPSNAFALLPSPDEPPPPLPDFIKSPAAPPPPPRPSSKSQNSAISTALTNEPKGNSSGSKSSQTSSNSSLQSPKNVSRTNLKSHNTHTDKTEGKKEPANNTPFSMQKDEDPFGIPLRSGPVSDSSKPSNRTTDPFASSSSSKDPFLVSSGASLGLGAQHSNDPFLPRPGDSTPKRNVKTSGDKAESVEDDDPFGIPLHLTPGFKMVAKFGDDPFEDSFSSNPASTDVSNWDPFKPENGKAALTRDSSNAWNSSPFGDPFATPAQPVNGDNSSSLLN